MEQGLRRKQKVLLLAVKKQNGRGKQGGIRSRSFLYVSKYWKVRV